MNSAFTTMAPIAAAGFLTLPYVCAAIAEAWDNHGSITIGNDVWIGYEAVILSGVTIGDGAIIGARAVVTRDIPPYTIAAGVPAKPIRRRFDVETIARLEELRWWDWATYGFDGHECRACPCKTRESSALLFPASLCRVQAAFLSPA